MVRFRKRYDLLVIDSDNTVRLVAGANLSRERAEQAQRSYPGYGHATVELVRAGDYSIGDDYDRLPDEEEE